MTETKEDFIKIQIPKIITSWEDYEPDESLPKPCKIDDPLCEACQ